jgi:succinate dehydrogenase / fumarate reductase cytochrome b subunit
MGNSLSILHRITGGFLAVGLLALSYWLVSLAAGEAPYGEAVRVLTSPLGWLFLCGWIFSFLYHLLNGVRHLLWDAGYGFERNQRQVSGWVVVLGACGLTIGVVLLVWHGANR